MPWERHTSPARRRRCTAGPRSAPPTHPAYPAPQAFAPLAPPPRAHARTRHLVGGVGLGHGVRHHLADAVVWRGRAVRAGRREDLARDAVPTVLQERKGVPWASGGRWGGQRAAGRRHTHVGMCMVRNPGSHGLRLRGPKGAPHPPAARLLKSVTCPSQGPPRSPGPQPAPQPAPEPAPQPPPPRGGSLPVPEHDQLRLALEVAARLHQLGAVQHAVPLEALRGRPGRAQRGRQVCALGGMPARGAAPASAGRARPRELRAARVATCYRHDTPLHADSMAARETKPPRSKAIPTTNAAAAA